MAAQQHVPGAWVKALGDDLAQALGIVLVVNRFQPLVGGHGGGVGEHVGIGAAAVAARHLLVQAADVAGSADGLGQHLQINAKTIGDLNGRRLAAKLLRQCFGGAPDLDELVVNRQRQTHEKIIPLYRTLY